MLNVNNTENLTGVRISGTFEDVNDLYEAIERLTGFEGDIPSHEGATNRVLGVCYDLRHCFMGDRQIEFVENMYHETLQKRHNKIHPQTNVQFAVNVLWLEAIFVVLALDDYIIIHEDDHRFKKKLEGMDMPEAAADVIREKRYLDIAGVRLFQELVWQALLQASGSAAYKRLYKASKAKQGSVYAYTNYNEYTIQFLDELEMKYLKAPTEKREKLLATLIRKIILKGDDYEKMTNGIKNYAKENNLRPMEVMLMDIEYPEDIEW